MTITIKIENKEGNTKKVKVTQRDKIEGKHSVALKDAFYEIDPNDSIELHIWDTRFLTVEEVL